MSVRGALRKLHLWAGLTAALLLLLLGVTGSVMVFEEEIDDALNARLAWVQPAGKRLSLVEMKAALEKANPGATVTSIGIPASEAHSWSAFLRGGKGVSFNPYTGAVLGAAADRNNFTGNLHQFHLRLLAGPTGKAIVGFAGPFLLFLSITGLILWWPRKILTLGRRFNFDLHNTVGVYSWIFLMIFAFTAIIIHWESEASAAANWLANSPEAPPFPQRQPAPPGAARLTPDQLLDIAQTTAPGARATMIQLEGNPIRIPMKYPEDRTPAGRTNIFLNAYTGEVVFHLNARTGPLGFRMVKLWNREIHTGDIFGWPTRILASLASLALPVMAITGPLIWWSRRRK